MITSLKTVADGRCLSRIQTPSNWYSMIDQTDVLKVRHPRYLSTKNTRPGQKDAATETRKPENEKTRKRENQKTRTCFAVFGFSCFRIFVVSRFRALCSILAFSRFGTYFTHAQSCDHARVQSATEWTASVHTLHIAQRHDNVRIESASGHMLNFPVFPFSRFHVLPAASPRPGHRFRVHSKKIPYVWLEVM